MGGQAPPGGLDFGEWGGVVRECGYSLNMTPTHI